MEYSLRRLVTAERLGTSVLEASRGEGDRRGDEGREDGSAGPASTKSVGSYFGGLLNNLNDPSKIPRRDVPLRFRKSVPHPQTQNTLPDTDLDSSVSHDLNTSLVCRSLSRPSSHVRTSQRPARLLSPQQLKVEPRSDSSELTVTLKKVSLNQRQSMLRRRGGRPQQSACVFPREKTFVSKGMDTSDPDEVRTSPIFVRGEKENLCRLKAGEKTEGEAGSVGTHRPRRRKNVVSQFLDHMVKEQAHRRAMPRSSSRKRTGLRSYVPKNKNRNSDAIRVLANMDPWDDFDEVLVGERPGSRAVVKLPSYRTFDLDSL